jgi:hypothetical protein
MDAEVDITEEYVNQLAQELSDAIDQVVLLEMKYPESYTIKRTFGLDVRSRIDWLYEFVEGDWGYYDTTFYFSNEKQKALFLLRWAE